MLKPLSKKLNTIFITTIMLIITFIMIILCKNYILMKQSNELLFFQRMVTQMMYQLEDSSHKFESIVNSYHDKNSIFCIIQNTSGKVIYQTDSDFPTDTDTLLEHFRIQVGKEKTFITENDSKPITNQSGIFEFRGTEQDDYLGILATIVLPNDTTYHLSLIYRPQSLFDI